MAAVEPAVPADSLSAAPATRAAAAGPGARARSEARAALYVHVPFCAVRCAYCDFASGAVTPRGLARWADALAAEIALRAGAASGTRFTSVFFGGGTPSALPPAMARETMARLRDGFTLEPDAEITIEANPESATDERLAAWRAMGVNRISLGVQSFDAGELSRLGRVHDPAAADRALARARTHGFPRRSLDLMFGFPGHGPGTWRRTLDRALDSSVEHLSAYAYIPEGGTPLGNAVARGEAEPAGDDAEADLYALLEERCAAAGFVPYETSNFCRPGAEARHNLTYWLRRPALALGPSAHGLWGGARYANHYALERWARDLERGRVPEASREAETGASVAQELLFLGLRLAGGIDRGDHSAPALAAFERRYRPALAAAVAAGRVERTAAGWRVPPALRFVADDAIAWIEARAAA